MQTPVWLEPLAVALTVLMVICNVAQIHWGWPLAIVSSALYFWVFGTQKLYGDAALQLLFIALAAYGWWQWLRKASHASTDSGPAWIPVALTGRQMLQCALLWGGLWILIVFILSHWTDSDVAWLDGFVTAGSVAATFYLARKAMLNWPMWLLVNVVSVVLFLQKHLWQTAALYIFLALMSVVGWRRWRRIAADARS